VKSEVSVRCIAGVNVVYLVSRDFIFEHIHSYARLILPVGLSHWVQSKRHRLFFSTKTCSCYSTKTHINSVILILKLNLTSLRHIYINICVVLNEDHFKCIFNLRMRIMLFCMSFRWVTTTLSSLRTTICDALIVPSVSKKVNNCGFSHSADGLRSYQQQANWDNHDHVSVDI